MDPDSREAWGSAGRVGAIGIEFALAVIVCLLIGRWADGELGTDPWLTVIGMGIGSAMGFRILYRAAKRLQEEDWPIWE